MSTTTTPPPPIESACSVTFLDWFDRRRPNRRQLCRCVGLLMLMQAVFLGLLVAAQAVPDHPIVEHLVEAVDEGLYGPNFRPNNMGGVSESFTECVAVGTGLGRPTLGVWERAMRVPRIGNCGAGAGQLQRLDAGESVAGVTEYFRYWAGYTALTRPVLALWGLGALRMLCGAILVAAGTGAMVAAGRRTSTSFAAALVIPLLVSSYVLAMPSTSFLGALALAAAFFSVALVAIGAGHGLAAALYGTVVGAAVFNYVDLLSTPAMPWMLSTVVGSAVILGRTRDTRRTAITAGAIGVAWPVAFGVTWAARWALAVVMLGWHHAWPVIGDKIGYRIAGSAGRASSGFGAATRVNVRYWYDTVPTSRVVLAGTLVVVAATLIVAHRRGGPRRLVWFGVLASPALIVPVWYEVLSNHSVIHATKVYVNIPAVLGVVAAAAIYVASIGSTLGSGSRRAGDPSPVPPIHPELQDGQEEASEDHRGSHRQAEHRRNDDANLLDRIETAEAGGAPSPHRRPAKNEPGHHEQASDNDAPFEPKAPQFDIGPGRRG